MLMIVVNDIAMDDNVMNNTILLVFSKIDAYSPFLSLFTLFLVLPSNLIVSDIKSSR